MFKDLYHPKVRRDLRKLDAAAREDIRTRHIPAIQADPGIADLLAADLEGVRSYHFRSENQPLRIAYTVGEAEKTVYILKIARR